MLLLLRRRARVKTFGPPEITASSIKARLIPAYWTGRQMARRAGLERLATEIELVSGEHIPLIGTHRAIADAVDLNHAISVAESYSTDWLQEVRDIDAPSRHAAYGGATKKLDYRLQVAARTEAAKAFGEERDTALRVVSNMESVRALDIVKVWDSVLDPERTCYICSSAHGTWVPLGEDFPEGTPGGVHPNCQCTPQILTMDMVSPMMAAA